MIEDQTITVTNKAQLITAFGCAIDFTGRTKITLIRKISKTFFTLDAPVYESMHGIYYLEMQEFNKSIRKARAKIRRTPAACFR